jgi:hypothetical protein
LLNKRVPANGVNFKSKFLDPLGVRNNHAVELAVPQASETNATPLQGDVESRDISPIDPHRVNRGLDSDIP